LNLRNKKMENSYTPWRRSRNKVIAGVCGGIAEKMNIDPVVVRLIFVILLVFGGGGLLAYIILWIVLPEEPWMPPQGFSKNETEASVTEEFKSSTDPFVAEAIAKKPTNNQTQLIAGVILIAMGALFLTAAFIPSIDAKDLWPVALILIGVFLLKPSSKY